MNLSILSILAELGEKAKEGISGDQRKSKIQPTIVEKLGAFLHLSYYDRKLKNVSDLNFENMSDKNLDKILAELNKKHKHYKGILDDIDMMNQENIIDADKVGLVGDAQKQLDNIEKLQERASEEKLKRIEDTQDEKDNKPIELEPIAETEQNIEEEQSIEGIDKSEDIDKVLNEESKKLGDAVKEITESSKLNSLPDSKINLSDSQDDVESIIDTYESQLKKKEIAESNQNNLIPTEDVSKISSKVETELDEKKAEIKLDEGSNKDSEESEVERLLRKFTEQQNLKQQKFDREKQDDTALFMQEITKLIAKDAEAAISHAHKNTDIVLEKNNDLTQENERLVKELSEEKQKQQNSEWTEKELSATKAKLAETEVKLSEEVERRIQTEQKLTEVEANFVETNKKLSTVEDNYQRLSQENKRINVKLDEISKMFSTLTGSSLDSSNKGTDTDQMKK